MANYTVSPNMNLPIPIPGTETSPQWATDIVNCLTLIDQHMHAPGYGVAVTPAGLNINSDLTFLSNNATSLRSSRYSLSSSALAGASDILCSYALGTNGDLYWNDANGNHIQITKNGSPNSGTGNISGLPSTPTGAAGVAWVNSQNTFQFTQDSGSPGANIDVGAVIVRYPGSYPTPSGNYIAIEVPSALSSSYKLILPAATPIGNPAFLTNTNDGSGQLFYTTLDTTTIKSIGNTLQVGIITNANITNNTIDGTKLSSTSVTGTQIATSVALNGSNVRINGLSAVTMAGNIGSSFKIIRGGVLANGTVASGENFTASLSGTTFTISFAANQFTGTTPTMVANCADGAKALISITGLSTTSATVRATDTSGNFITCNFFFIAIGPV